MEHLPRGGEGWAVWEQLDAWFGDELGLPILALGGYASQSFVAEVRDDIARQDRPAVLIYAVCDMTRPGRTSTGILRPASAASMR